MIDLSGHVALVTGASRGIGRSCAIRLGQAGADVVVNSISRPKAAQEVARTITALGRTAWVVKADVSSEADVAAMAEYVGEEAGRLDILVCNAATGGFRSLLDTTTAQFESAMSTNVAAFIHLVKSFAPLLTEAATQAGPHGPRRPKVIAMSSHGARFALPSYGLIGATKAALESLVRHSARELGPRGINVNALIPGLVRTDAVVSMPDVDEMFRRDQRRLLTSGRALTVEEVADVALFLASPLADLVQGQMVVVDGGASVSFG